MAYDGYFVDKSKSDLAIGALVLPSDYGWEILQSKAKSNNAKARLILITFPSNATGLSSLQITIPFEGKGEKEKLLVGIALCFADPQVQEARATLHVNNEAEKEPLPFASAKATLCVDDKEEKEPSPFTSAMAFLDGNLLLQW